MNIAPGLQPLAVPIDSITRWPGNPKGHDLQFIGRLLTTYGQWRPAVAQKSTGRILIGNGMHEAAQQIGATELAVEFLDVDDETAKRIIIADNRASDLGGYDETALATMLTDLQASATGLDLTGFTDEDLTELQELADTVTELEPDDLDDTSTAPTPGTDTVSTPGDVWLLGPHRLMCGDSTNPDHLKQLVADHAPTIVYTDPPYGISVVTKKERLADGGTREGVGGGGLVGGKHRMGIGAGKIVAAGHYLPVAGDGTTQTATDAFQLLTTEYPNASHIWWGGNYYVASAGLPDSRCWLVWDKENSTTDFADAELAWTNHTGSVRLLRHMWNGMLRASERGKRVHPTQKPVALAEWAFRVVDPNHERETVLDVFGGSGSTLLACHTTGRIGLLMEMEPAYVDVICRRYQEASRTRPVLEATGESHDFTTSTEGDTGDDS